MAKSIMIVDDNFINLQLMESILEDDYDITAVLSGKRCLEALKKRHYDLILLDYQMPEMNGAETLRRIREESCCTDVKVIFLTSESEEYIIETVNDLSYSGYIGKPVDAAGVLEYINEVIG